VSNGTQESAQRSRRRTVNTGIKILIPVAFVVLTVFNVVSIMHEGRSTPTTAPTTPAQQVSLATVGEIGSSASAMETLDAMAKKRPDLYLALGDLSDEGVGSEQKWCSFVRAQIGPVAPFELVAGRNEEDGSDAGHLASLSACLPDRMGAQGTYAAQYYFDLAKLARVIVIAPNLTIDGTNYGYGKGSPEYEWLQGAIAAAQSAGTRWVIVAMNDDCVNDGQYYCDIGPELMSLLVDDHVDLVLTARDHSYQRSAQIATNSHGCSAVPLNAFNRRCLVDGPSTTMHRHAGTVFAVVGSASSDLYKINGASPDAGYLVASMGQNREPRRGYLLLTIRDSTLSGKFEPSSPGTFSDQFTIHAGAARRVTGNPPRSTTTASTKS
jgi:hypothetical protein